MKLSLRSRPLAALVAVFFTIAIGGFLSTAHGTSYVCKGCNEVFAFERMASKSIETMGGTIPKNWSEIWDASSVTTLYVKNSSRPLLYERMQFVEGEISIMTPKPGEARILAASTTPFKSRRGSLPWQVATMRGVLLVNAKSKMEVRFVEEGKKLGNIDLRSLRFRKPDLSKEQIAQASTQLIDLGATAADTLSALGQDFGNIVPELKIWAERERIQKAASDKNEDQRPRLKRWIDLAFYPIYLIALGFLLFILFRRRHGGKAQSPD